jgi:3-aminobutyryl-CoA ammonia-lyase
LSDVDTVPAPDLGRYVAGIEIRVDSHYPDGVVSLGTIVELFGMAGTKLAYMLDGDGGLMRAFDNVEFLAPVYHGDFVRVTARLLGVGRTSRRRGYEAHVVARTFGVGTGATCGELLEPPLLVARATGTTVTPLERQRLTPSALRGRARAG